MATLFLLPRTRANALLYTSRTRLPSSAAPSNSHRRCEASRRSVGIGAPERGRPHTPGPVLVGCCSGSVRLDRARIRLQHGVQLRHRTSQGGGTGAQAPCGVKSPPSGRFGVSTARLLSLGRHVNTAMSHEQRAEKVQPNTVRRSLRKPWLSSYRNLIYCTAHKLMNGSWPCASDFQKTSPC